MSTTNIQSTLLKDMEVLEELESQAFVRGDKRTAKGIRDLIATTAELLSYIVHQDGLPLSLEIMANVIEVHMLTNQAMLLVFKSHKYV